VKFQSTLFEAYGAVQKEYVTVPESLLANTEELVPFFNLSYEHAKAQKPKPTKRKVPEESDSNESGA